MPRPPVERVARSIRLPAEVDQRLVAQARRAGRSINEEVELAVSAWCDSEAIHAELGLPPTYASPASVLAAQGPSEPPGGPVAPVAAPANRDGCEHKTRRHLGYATRCADCGALIR